jgi:hypothetical protein
MQYFKEKIVKSTQLKSSCDLNLEINEDSITYTGKFYSEYVKKLSKEDVTFTHELVIDKNNGDFTVTFSVNNKKNETPFKNKSWSKKNNFNKLYVLTEDGVFRGEKRKNYWGVKYDKVILEMIGVIRDDIIHEFDGTFLEDKEYFKLSDLNSLYDMVTDYHLFKKKIKPHNNIYRQIMDVYPKLKWLKKNDNKFLPAILDEYGIKSKYLIKELSSTKNGVNLTSLIYICGLFGENHLDYIKKFDWKKVSNGFYHINKNHKCKDDIEKKYLVNVFKSSEIKPFYNRQRIYDLFELRHFMENNDFGKLKIRAKSMEEINILIEEWQLLKRYRTIGYKLKFNIPEDIIRDIERPIIMIENIFRVKFLITEEDFTNEGNLMRNCMSRQFFHGSVCMFFAITLNKKRINIQYKSGKIVQFFGKANTQVPMEIFGTAMSILTERVSKYSTLSREREKYDIIKK